MYELSFRELSFCLADSLLFTTLSFDDVGMCPFVDLSFRAELSFCFCPFVDLSFRVSFRGSVLSWICPFVDLSFRLSFRGSVLSVCRMLPFRSRSRYNYIDMCLFVDLSFCC